MVSRYGFETAEERRGQAANRAKQVERIGGVVTFILEDYGQAMEVGTRVETITDGWTLHAAQDAAITVVVKTVQIVPDEDEIVLRVTVQGSRLRNSRNTQRLRDVLKKETGLLVLPIEEAGT